MTSTERGPLHVRQQSPTNAQSAEVFLYGDRAQIGAVAVERMNDGKTYRRVASAGNPSNSALGQPLHGHDRVPVVFGKCARGEPGNERVILASPMADPKRLLRNDLHRGSLAQLSRLHLQRAGREIDSAARDARKSSRAARAPRRIARQVIEFGRLAACIAPPMGSQSNASGKRLALVAGGTGFVGRALLPELVAAGYAVRATSRRMPTSAPVEHVEWLACDVQQAADLDRALRDVHVAFFLVHAMGSGKADFAEAEQHSALAFREAAARAGVKRIIYLGGVAPAADPSEHLQSRLRVGELLREGLVPTLELRASMIIGNGSVSWQIVRDLALRLPAMLLPSWTDSRTCPVAIEDVTKALLRGVDFPLAESTWYDIAGPEILSAREILMRVAALRGRHLPSLRVPFLSVSLSSWWLKLVTRADFAVARELVLGLSTDLLPTRNGYWDAIGYQPEWSFEDSARRALAAEGGQGDSAGVGARLEEAMVQLVARKLPR